VSSRDQLHETLSVRKPKRLTRQPTVFIVSYYATRHVVNAMCPPTNTVQSRITACFRRPTSCEYRAASSFTKGAVLVLKPRPSSICNFPGRPWLKKCASIPCPPHLDLNSKISSRAGSIGREITRPHVQGGCVEWLHPPCTLSEFGNLAVSGEFKKSWTGKSQEISQSILHGLIGWLVDSDQSINLNYSVDSHATARWGA